ncbi:hypothetical protein OF83DRAFT_1178677 [Amylostereum chailletii]|nr:hypothetical protein OF83DRAFT_1178677 [Amylostereum chailletii]
MPMGIEGACAGTHAEGEGVRGASAGACMQACGRSGHAGIAGTRIAGRRVWCAGIGEGIGKSGGKGVGKSGGKGEGVGVGMGMGVGVGESEGGWWRGNTGLATSAMSSVIFLFLLICILFILLILSPSQRQSPRPQHLCRRTFNVIALDIHALHAHTINERSHAPSSCPRPRAQAARDRTPTPTRPQCSTLARACAQRHRTPGGSFASKDASREASAQAAPQVRIPSFLSSLLFLAHHPAPCAPIPDVCASPPLTRPLLCPPRAAPSTCRALHTHARPPVRLERPCPRPRALNTRAPVPAMHVCPLQQAHPTLDTHAHAWIS